MSSVPSLNLFSQQVDTNRPFQFEKRSELVIGTHNAPLSVTAMCVSDPDRQPPAMRAMCGSGTGKSILLWLAH